MSKVKNPRCANITCNKRIKSVIIIECKCGAKFCNTNHMIPYKEHNCMYDFSKEAKTILSKSLTTAYTDINTKMERV